MDEQTIADNAAKLAIELGNMLTAENKRTVKTRNQLALMEECCVGDWHKEALGFKAYRGKKQGEGKATYYTNAEHAQKLIKRGSRLTRECDANRDCLTKRLNLTLGSNLTYKLEVKPPLANEYEAKKQSLAQVRQAVELALFEINKQGSSFRSCEKEIVRRYFRDGNKICVCDDDDSNEHGVVFIEPCDFRQPTGVDNPDDPEQSDEKLYSVELWEYGIVALRTSPKKKIGYWICGMSGTDWDQQESLEGIEGTSDEFGFIPIADLMHLKNRVDIDDPLGVPQAEGTQDWSLAMKLLTMKAADSMNCQFDYTVIRTIASQADTTEKRSRDILDYASGKKDSKSDHRDDGPAEMTLKNETVELNSVASQANASALGDSLAQKIGGAWEMPGFMVTGDGGSGNRSNFETMLQPLFASINCDRSMFASVFVAIIEKMLQRGNDVSELFEYLYVSASFEQLTTSTVLELCQIDVLKVQNGFQSPQDVIRRNNGDPDRVCRETQDFRNKNNDNANPLNLNDTGGDEVTEQLIEHLEGTENDHDQSVHGRGNRGGGRRLSDSSGKFSRTSDPNEAFETEDGVRTIDDLTPRQREDLERFSLQQADEYATELWEETDEDDFSLSANEWFNDNRNSVEDITKLWRSDIESLEDGKDRLEEFLSDNDVANPIEFYEALSDEFESDLRFSGGGSITNEFALVFEEYERANRMHLEEARSIFIEEQAENFDFDSSFESFRETLDEPAPKLKENIWFDTGIAEKLEFEASNGQRYRVGRTKREKDGITSADIVFGQLSEDGELDYSVTGSGGGRNVFRNVVSSLTKLHEEDPADVMTFSAAEESRRSLYSLLVRRFKRNIGPEYRAFQIDSREFRQFILVRGEENIEQALRLNGEEIERN